MTLGQWLAYTAIAVVAAVATMCALAAVARGEARAQQRWLAGQVAHW